MRSLIYFVLLGLLISISACSTLPSVVDKPKVEFAGLRIDRLDLNKPEFTVILRVSNTKNIGLPIKSIEMKCDLSGKPFAEGHSLQAVNLPAHGNALMELHLNIQKDGLTQLAQDLLFHPNESVKYHLLGYATLTQLELRTEFEFTGTTDLGQILGKKKT